MTYILAEALIFAIALTPLGYMVYRAHRITMIERMGRQLHSDIVGYVNGRPYRLDNEGNPIYGYQPTDEPAEHNPPQGGSVISPYTGEPYDPEWWGTMLYGGKVSAREASEAMRVMYAALPVPDDLPISPYISPYAKDEIYEPVKE